MLVNDFSCYVDLSVLIDNVKIKVFHDIIPCKSKFLLLGPFDKYIKCQLLLWKINYWFLTFYKHFSKIICLDKQMPTNSQNVFN